MSGAHPSHDAAHHDAAHADHGSTRSYLIGFALSVVLTLASFGVVMSGLVPHDLMMPGIIVFGVAQLVVQLVCFLHMGTSPSQRSNLAIMLFTLLILAIVVVGSLWVLHNMNVNMMHPTSHMMPVE
ncbi:cytochrome o ubiquinol oxidase subunit IV [Dyella jiangningensis]|uniref:Cytochrome bo(3) ubiquinol oxidase subunit 4 n=1 Tax=Dyella jiangningensis TaxID=1379159 RepID=A0A328P9D7_9GAMM|nr:cytochrome o ubiquinol oxidase subunit IV [Dyella jiangningensis]RAO77893.1 cytochrome o ubiquinol oxidase subunit IV [Dyella jiangningensis]